MHRHDLDMAEQFALAHVHNDSAADDGEQAEESSCNARNPPRGVVVVHEYIGPSHKYKENRLAFPKHFVVV